MFSFFAPSYTAGQSVKQTPMHTITNRTRPVRYTAALVSALILGAGTSWAQQQSTPEPVKPAEGDTIVLSPFEVSSSNTNGYAAATTLAGNRLNTQLRDIGNAVQVVTTQFLKDIGATDNQTLLQYTTNTEVGSAYGNFSGTGDGATLDESPHFTNPNQNTRIRGLTSADNTRDYFLTDIPWEGYNVDGVDLQRGPNSILFGQGSPAGIINTRTKQASFKDSGEVSFRVGSFGSTRATLDVNRVLIKDELAFRLDGVLGDEQYKQDPAFAKNKRLYGATRWEGCEPAMVWCQPARSPSWQDGGMERVLGIGGYFMRAADPAALGAWYRDCLGLDADENGLWRQEAGPTVFATFESETDYFGSRAQQTMLNFRVRDLDAMLAQLRAKGADVAEETQDMEGVGRFGWVTDPEGNRIELWQPA